MGKWSNELSKRANGLCWGQSNSIFLALYFVGFIVQCWFFTYNGLEDCLSENDVENGYLIKWQGPTWSNIVKRSNLGGLYGLGKGYNVARGLGWYESQEV